MPANLFQFPRARLFLDEYNLQLSPQCQRALKDLNDDPTDQRLREFSERFGEKLSYESVYDWLKAHARRSCLCHRFPAWWAVTELKIRWLHAFKYRYGEGRCFESRRRSKLRRTICLRLCQILQRHSRKLSSTRTKDFRPVKSGLDSSRRQHSALCQVSSYCSLSKDIS